MSTGDSDDPRARSLTDDPRFMASLSDLDEGLGLADGVVGHVVRPAASVRPVHPTLPPLVTVPGRRPLLDLFPEAAASSGAESIARSSSAFQFTAERTPSGPATSYEAFYGFSDRPFSLSSDPKFLYLSSEYDRVAQQMLGAIGRREPLVLLTGEIGVGKTTLCRALVEQIDRHTLTSVVTEPFATMDELLKRLLLDFGVASKDEVSRGRMASATEGELAGALHEFLLTLAPLQAFAVVIIDEAQALPPAVLQQLRHLIFSDDRAMQIILVGQPPLAAALGTASELGKKVSLRLTLGTLADDEVGGYVMHRLRVVALNPGVEFDDEAIERLCELSGGKPRLINLLCDRALSGGVATSASVIGRALVNAAAEDLDMAPPPREGAFANMPSAAIIALLFLAGVAAGALTFHNAVAAILARLAH